jgi:hypothetical protein
MKGCIENEEFERETERATHIDIGKRFAFNCSSLRNPLTEKTLKRTGLVKASADLDQRKRRPSGVKKLENLGLGLTPSLRSRRRWICRIGQCQ